MLRQRGEPAIHDLKDALTPESRFKVAIETLRDLGTKEIKSMNIVVSLIGMRRKPRMGQIVWLPQDNL